MSRIVKSTFVGTGTSGIWVTGSHKRVTIKEVYQSERDRITRGGKAHLWNDRGGDKERNKEHNWLEAGNACDKGFYWKHRFG